ncbi:MAG: hypothetical protein V1843_03530, partial [bacterium]
ITPMGSNGIIKNNVVSKCSLGIGCSSTDVLYNNIIGNCNYGISASYSSVALFYNNVWSIRYRNYCDGGQAGPYDISLDPLFVDPDNGDFHLLPNSPCRDAGSPEVSFNDPDGSRNDMGAYGGPGAADWKPITSGLPVVTQIIVSPNPVAKDGTITIKATGKIQY